jgi:MFS family permease
MWLPLRRSNFRRFFAAAVVSNAGSWMQSVAVPFTVFEITDSKTWLGVTAFTGMFVSMLANTPGGMLADRYPRRLVLAATQALAMASALSLWALWTLGHPSIATMMPLLVIGAIGGGLTMPVWQSFIPSLVPSGEVAAAIRLNSMQFAVARAIGPVLGAITLKSFGASACFMTNAVSYLVIIAVLLIVPEGVKRPPVRRAPLRLAQVFADVGDGWRYLRSQPGLQFAPIAVFVNSAFGFGLTTLAPAMARDQFHHLANDNGTLIGAFGLGGVIGVFAIGTYFGRSRASFQVRSALIAWVVSDVVLVLTGNFVLGCLAFAIAGAANSVGGTALNTSVQVQVDDNYRGRVMGIYMQMFFLGSAVGSLVLGVTADLTSLRFAAGLSAMVFVVFHLWSALRYDRFRVLDARSPRLG